MEDSWWGGRHSICLKSKSGGLSPLAGRTTSAATRTFCNNHSYKRGTGLLSHSVLPSYPSRVIFAYPHSHSPPPTPAFVITVDIQQFFICGCETAYRRPSRSLELLAKQLLLLDMMSGWRFFFFFLLLFFFFFFLKFHGYFSATGWTEHIFRWTAPFD